MTSHQLAHGSLPHNSPSYHLLQSSGEYSAETWSGCIAQSLYLVSLARPPTPRKELRQWRNAHSTNCFSAFASSIVKTVELRSIGDRSDYSCKFPSTSAPFSSLVLTNLSPVNTVPFMNWVVIENTFVIIGASIPLMRPLFSRAKQQAMSAYGANTGYEMNSGSANGRKGPFSATQPKSIVLQSSSEENILPLHGLHGGIGGSKLATHIGTNNQYGNEDFAEMGIKKETSVQVRYDENYWSPNKGKASRCESRINVRGICFRSIVEAPLFEVN